MDTFIQSQVILRDGMDRSSAYREMALIKINKLVVLFISAKVVSYGISNCILICRM